METTHLEATTRLLNNIHSLTHPEDEDNPLGGSNEIAHNIQSSTSLEDGDNPLGGSNEIAPQHIIIKSP